MRNILLTIAYDGTDFCGWQRQPGRKTVCGELELALAALTGRAVKLNGASRTDAGVHARGQRASFELPDEGIPTERLPKALNDMLAKDRLEGVGAIRVLEARDMPPDFHARFCARGKRYIYKIYNGPDKDVFRRTRFYEVTAAPLDIGAMRAAAAYVTGTHDFKCFESAGSTPRESTVRTVFRLDVEPRAASDGAPEIDMIIEGDGFLYNMVRIIAGTLVEAGLGRRSPGSVAAAIDSKDRANAGHTAPPQGLYLDEVFY